MNIIVIHTSRTARYVDPDQVFPLYRGKSILANPYTHLPLNNTKAQWQVTTVEEAIRCYATWLDFSIINNREINKAMRVLYNRAVALYKAQREVYLACWCKDELDPRRDDHGCHCDVVRDRLMQKWINDGF